MTTVRRGAGNGMGLNGFDAALLVLVGVLGVIGLLKGLARLLIGLGALAAAFVLAARFHLAAAAPVQRTLEIPEPAAQLTGYLGIFLATLIAGAVLGRLLRQVLKAAMLGWADRLAGAAAGVAAALVAAGLVGLPVIAYAPAGDRLLRASLLAPWVTLVADAAAGLVPADLAARYHERMAALRQTWRDRAAAAALTPAPPSPADPAPPSAARPPDAAGPDAAGPDAAKPDAARPDAAGSETGRPEAVPPPVRFPGDRRGGAAAPDAGPAPGPAERTAPARRWPGQID